ncbi:MAG: DJ-1/PfpI family protein [Methanomethylovorans sp.]|uniref:DJ-1/PfpI family protein n=1 Tax=Methanomethylovorans sp. TaxID=2758717 RepID=UPI0035316494
MSSELEDKKILMVVAQDNFRDEEYFEPRDVLEDAGVSITVASNSTKEAHGALGGKIKPDLSIKDAIMAEFDGLIIAGGGGSREHLWPSKDLQRLVKDAFDQDKIVAAICVSPVVLARAKVLEDRDCTVFKDKECIAEIEKYGGIYKDKDVVVDGNIVTARDPKTAEKFGHAIVDLLAAEE